MASPELGLMSNPIYSAYPPPPPFEAQTSPSPSFPGDPQPVKKDEIEVYNARYIAMATFLISFFNMGLICYIIHYKSFSSFSLGGTEKVYVVLTVSFLVAVHFCYTLTMLAAPRFLYRGMVWLKALPWIVSGISICVIYIMISNRTTSEWIGGGFILVFQVIQYIICVLQQQTPLTAFLKPYEKVLVPNLLAKIDLFDPNTGLNEYFGPPISIPSGIAGQQPAIIRYGSQAKNIVTQQPIIMNPMMPMNQQIPMGQQAPMNQQIPMGQQIPINQQIPMNQQFPMGQPPQFPPQPQQFINEKPDMQQMMGQSPYPPPGPYQQQQQQPQFPPQMQYGMASTSQASSSPAPAPAYQPPIYEQGSPQNIQEKSQFDSKK